jgi:hypothetical protein
MTSRRSQEKSYADAAAAPQSKESASSDITPAVPADVIYKLLGFTAAMVFGPIGMYFVTVNSGGMSFFHPISNFALFKIHADLKKRVQLWLVSRPPSLRIWSYSVISTWHG